MNQEKIGKFLAELRKEKGLTQREFAEKLGVTDKTVSRWENGHYLPDVSLFHEICEIFGIEVVDFLNGERGDRENDSTVTNQTIQMIVDISKDEIQKKKRKIIFVSVTLLFGISIIFGFLWFKRGSEQLQDFAQPKDPVRFPRQVAIQERDDGWVCSFDIEYFQEDIKTPYYYGYNCENFKYKELTDFTALGEEVDENGIYQYAISTNHPMYIYNPDYNDDIRKIGEYFQKKGFREKIGSSDLDGLELQKISKTEVLELYNQAISSNKIFKYGPRSKLRVPSYRGASLKKDNCTWLFGYISNYGYISYVYIDLMIGDTYLSDLISSGKSTEVEKELFQNIQKIKSHILKTHSFSLPSKLKKVRPYTFLLENFHDVSGFDQNS